MTADEEDALARRHNLVATDPHRRLAQNRLTNAVLATILFATLLGLIGPYLGT